MTDAVEAGDVVCLVDEKGNRYLARTDAPVDKIKGVGVLDPKTLVGVPYGGEFPFGNKTFRVYPPGYADLSATVRRKAAIILPKDASRILFECDVRAGARVLEAGIGSAALTTALARAVTPGGRVFTYELRDDFAEWGRRNLESAGLADAVEVKVRDVIQGVDERDLDAAILDMPNPWDAVPAVRAALRGGGHLCAYTPLVTQMEQTHAALAEHGFREVRSMEILEREWVVGERGSRPSHHVLGHTAFLTFARKSVDPDVVPGD